MKSNEKIMDNFKASGGISILPFLGLVFVILKLCKVIDWSWIWVTCPFWACLVICILWILIVAIKALTIEVYKHLKSEKQ